MNKNRTKIMFKSRKCFFQINVMVGVTIIFLMSGSANAAGENFSSAILLSGSTTGSVVQGSYVYYKFYMNSEQQTNVTLSPLSSDQDLIVYDPNQTQIGNSNNIGISIESYSFTASSPGYYYAAVYGYRAGSYIISISNSSVHNINKRTNYTNIQAAINDSNQGDEIHVDNGGYYENVNVTKRLILRGIGMPVVDAMGSGSAITLAADGIILEGFTATGGAYDQEAGIKVTSNSNTLSGNNASNNGGQGYGIWLSSSSNNTLSGNNVSNNGFNGHGSVH